MHTLFAAYYQTTGSYHNLILKSVSLNRHLFIKIRFVHAIVIYNILLDYVFMKVRRAGIKK